MFLKKDCSLGLKKGFISTITIVLLMVSLGACSNKEVENLKNSIKDPVEIVPKGLEGEVLDNVKAHLNTLPQISLAKAPVFSREIEEKVKLSLRAFGYYHPKINMTFPKDGDENRQLLVDIDPGKPLFIRNCNIEIIGEGAYYQSFKNIIQESGLSSYSMLSHGKYEDLKNALRERALALGFFDAELIISRILVFGEQNAADIEVLYDTGKRYQFGSITYVDDESENLSAMESVKKLQNFYPGTPFQAKRLQITHSLYPIPNILEPLMCALWLRKGKIIRFL